MSEQVKREFKLSQIGILSAILLEIDSQQPGIGASLEGINAVIGAANTVVDGVTSGYFPSDSGGEG